MAHETIVVIGAGQAGGWAVRTLREQGHAGEICLVGEEAFAPYERPPLSKAFLLEDVDVEQLTILNQAELDTLNINTYLDLKVTRIDRNNRQVHLNNGTVIKYGKLLIATGGRAALPPISGVQLPGVYKLRNLDDAHRIRAHLKQEPQQQVAIIGGGWIGLELAAACKGLGHQVTIIEAAERLCQRSVDHVISTKLEQLHQQNGVQIYYETYLAAIEQVGNELSLHFTNGDEKKFQVVILAIGLKANDELALEAGINTANGILVNTRNQSSDPLIYAAGDVAILPCTYSATGRRHESWQNAQDQGIAAAKAILGDESDYQPTPLLWSEQFDLMIRVYGYINHASRILVRESSPKGTLFFYLNEENQTIGVVAWNAGRDFRFARQLVDQKRLIDDTVLMNSSLSLAQIIKGEKV